MNLSKSIIRLITGLIIGFTAFFAIIYGGVPLALLILVVIILASKEYSSILKHKGFAPSFKIIAVSGIFFELIVYFNLHSLIPLAFTIAAFTAFMWVLFKGKQPYIANVATTILGFVYCGWFPVHLLLLRDIGSPDSIIYNGLIKQNLSSEGAIFCLLLLLGVILTDSFCYYTGVQFGKHKLAEVISPNKTIEGSVGGSFICIVFSLIFGYFIQIGWYHALAIGILIAAFSQIGDLCESMIKRDAGVKDSSDILPGHGGFLDRTDSYVLTIPVIYYYLQFFVYNNFSDILKGLF